MALPIWQDVYVTIYDEEWEVSYNADNGIEFYIEEKDGEVRTELYRGVAHLRPGQTKIEVKVNDIIAEHLYKDFPELISQGVMPTPCPYFNLNYRGADLQGGAPSYAPVFGGRFYGNWSYDETYDPNTDGMAFPINGKVDIRQPLFYTAAGVYKVDAYLTLADGSKVRVILPLSRFAIFNEDFNNDFDLEREYKEMGTAVINLQQYGDVKSVNIGNATYEVASGCNRYALYYINAYGGWDSLLIEGNHSMADSLVRHTREMAYNNSSVSNRGRENYLNEIDRRMTLTTSWLTDDESSRMHHLLNATQVYLYDMVEQKMIPVILENTTTEYKTYKTNGNRLVNYTIEVSYANSRIRR